MTAKKLIELEKRYENGDFCNLEDRLVPFFLENREELIQFLTDFNYEKNSTHNLIFYLKLFILHKNLPVDQKDYMKAQTDFIKSCLNERNDANQIVGNKDYRQKKVTEWIGENAQIHRSDWIINQLFCLEKNADEITHRLQKELNL